MLEWYRADAPYAVLMEDCAALLKVAAAGGGCGPPALSRPRGRSVSLRRNGSAWPKRFRRHAGIDLLATLAADGRSERDALARQVEGAGLRIAPDDTWSDLFSRVLSERVEPHLGQGRATILHDYPRPEAALARPAADPRLAERFELYACGVELANGFGELTDPNEQRRRFERDMDERERIYGERHPVDADFLAALAQMPPASGIALGLDRLVMLCTGAERIEQVLWAPVVDPSAR